MNDEPFLSYQHAFQAFQPLRCFSNAGVIPVVIVTSANWLALFGVFYVVGTALKLGWGG